MPDPHHPPAPRTAVAYVAATVLHDPRIAAARIHPPHPDPTTTAAAGRTDLHAHVHAETTTGRRLTITVITDDDPLDDYPADIPSWTFPGPFGDALAHPDPRRWTALTTGGPHPTGMFLAPEHALRRIVMARHLNAARHGVWTRLAHDTTTLDLGIDLAPIRGLFLDLHTVLDTVEADPHRPGDTTPTTSSRSS